MSQNFDLLPNDLRAPNSLTFKLNFEVSEVQLNHFVIEKQHCRLQCNVSKLIANSMCLKCKESSHLHQINVKIVIFIMIYLLN